MGRGGRKEIRSERENGRKAFLYTSAGITTTLGRICNAGAMIGSFLKRSFTFRFGPLATNETALSLIVSCPVLSMLHKLSKAVDESESRTARFHELLVLVVRHCETLCPRRTPVLGANRC